MTNPGARQAQQNYQRQVQQNSANFARDTAYQAQLRNHRRGPVGPVRRLLRFLFSLMFLAIAVGIVLAILSAAQPEWFDYLKTWFNQIF
jgi:hypothetical protein